MNRSSSTRRMHFPARGLRIACAWAGLVATTQAGDRSDWGPLYQRGETLSGQQRTAVAGPFYEHREDGTHDSLTAFRPFYAVSHFPSSGFTRREVLWPLAQSTRFRQEHVWRVLTAYGARFDVDDPHSRYRVWVFPVYFQGRTAKGDSYLAVFPLGGRIRQFATRDEIEFVLFPVWLRHRVNDVVTTSWLFPLISSTSGDGQRRFRVFPLYGYARREGFYSKRFILWPVWTEAEWVLPEGTGRGYILFPLWGRTRIPNEETLMILPPFFRFTRGERRNLTYCPWPFIQHVQGQDLEKLYLWPLWGRKTTENEQSQFFLWPVGSTRRIDRPETTYRQVSVLPFFQSRTERWNEPPEAAAEPEVLRHDHRVWPLWSYERDGDEGRFQTLALWPARRHGVVERNWAPLWTLYRREFTKDELDSELLWGLYRHTRSGESQRSWSVFPLFAWDRDDRAEPYRQWSLLRGLFGIEREGDSRRYRLLYLLRFGGKETETL